MMSARGGLHATTTEEAEFDAYLDKKITHDMAQLLRDAGYNQEAMAMIPSDPIRLWEELSDVPKMREMLARKPGLIHRLMSALADIVEWNHGVIVEPWKIEKMRRRQAQEYASGIGIRTSEPSSRQNGQSNQGGSSSDEIIID